MWGNAEAQRGARVCGKSSCNKYTLARTKTLTHTQSNHRGLKHLTISLYQANEVNTRVKQKPLSAG